MLGFERLETAAITITGIELEEKIQARLLAGQTCIRSGYLGCCARCIARNILPKPSVAHSEKFAPEPYGPGSTPRRHLLIS